MLEQKFNKIKRQQDTYKWKDEVDDVYNFCLVDKDDPFSIEDFISILRNRKKQVRINFAVGYLLREENSELLYFHTCIQNMLLLEDAFRINEEKDLDLFRIFSNEVSG